MRVKWVVSENLIEKVKVEKDSFVVSIPVDKAEFSKSGEIEEHLKALWDIGVRLECLLPEEVGASSGDDEIERFCDALSGREKDIFEFLDSGWKRKEDLYEHLGIAGSPQMVSGFNRGITSKARKCGIIEKNESGVGDRGKIIEKKHEKYRLTDLGLKIKNRIS